MKSITQNELLILLDELNSFVEKTDFIDVYERRVRFAHELITKGYSDKGVINRLEKTIPECLVQDAYSDVKEIDQLNKCRLGCS